MSEQQVKKPVLMPCGHPQEAVSYGDEGTNYCRWCEEVARLEEERDDYKKAYDDPEMDATEGAHPAWWRGEAYAATKWKERCERAEKALDEARCPSGGAEHRTYLRELEEARASLDNLDAEREGLRVLFDAVVRQRDEADAQASVMRGALLIARRHMPSPCEEWRDDVDVVTHALALGAGHKLLDEVKALRRLEACLRTTRYNEDDTIAIALTAVDEARKP